jgi:hypothetical protein
VQRKEISLECARDFAANPKNLASEIPSGDRSAQ